MVIDSGIVTKIKTSIRISHNKLDEDVRDTIAACLTDLHVCGIMPDKLDASHELDPLILNAVKAYCKADYTDDPVKAARYQEGYDNVKASLMMAEGYGWEVVADE